MDPRLPLTEVAAHARRVEAMGYDGLHVAETVHDAFAVALLAAEHTERITIRTSVALAFVRSPTLVAYAAWDLSRFSGGRFELGLGTQIRQHVEERFGMPWGEPVARLRDHVAAVAALFDAFRTGTAPRHEGRWYRITRMPPYFNPGPDAATRVPPLWLGGVGARACELGGELAAGFVTHPTSSNPRYLDAVCRPHLALGAARAGRALADLELVAGTPVITGATDAALAVDREHQRRLLAFLYSTPAYRPTLELHGWEALGDDLRACVRAERWSDLPAVLPDEVLETLVPTAVHTELAALLLARYAHLVDGLVLSPPADPTHDPAFSEVVAALQRARGLRGDTEHAAG
jgi:probable F420-dependent oxidoreductase